MIAIDAVFTPITNARYSIQQTRVGERIDYEKLTMEVATDGSVSPEDALTQAAAVLRDHVNLFIKMDSEPQPTEEEKEVDAEVQRIRELLAHGAPTERAVIDRVIELTASGGFVDQVIDEAMAHMVLAEQAADRIPDSVLSPVLRNLDSYILGRVEEARG